MSIRDRQVLNGRLGEVEKSADSRRNPRKHARTHNEKGQPRVVDLYELVEEGGIKPESARPPHSPHMLISVFAFDRLLTGSLRISKIQQLRTTRVLHISLTLLVLGNSTSRISILTAPGQAVLRSSSCAVSGISGLMFNCRPIARRMASRLESRGLPSSESAL